MDNAHVVCPHCGIRVTLKATWDKNEPSLPARLRSMLGSAGEAGKENFKFWGQTNRAIICMQDNWIHFRVGNSQRLARVK